MRLQPILLIALTSAFPAYAQQNCDKPRDDFDSLYCLNKVYVETDAELNSAYKDLVTRLPKDGRSKLKHTQLAWIEQRNAECSRKIDNGFFVNLSCATETTRQRLEFVQERIRECKSSGCQPSKL
ncbi:MAG: hypothetical protein RLZZ352_153 [Pseudomonadota bacterium]|jgi:uncharacterized protein YecT (DUF1311 family)